MIEKRTVATFSIPYYRFLSPEGIEEQPIPGPARDASLLKKMYRCMVLTRHFDKKAIALQRTGKLGTYPSTLGQEAIGVGIGAAMRAEDVFCPYYREYAGQFWRGVTMTEILLYWGGDERGSDFQGPRQDFPICVPIASQTLHAAGVAMAFQLRKEKRVAVTCIGDGGTSRGDFYEATNVAGVRNLPVVFVINNNQWAISVPRAQQSHAETLAQKAIANGIEGVQIDGNDATCVYHAVFEAVEKARSGGGPTVIEAITYRMCDHTTADDAKRYRSDSELALHHPEDPIVRLRTFLASQGWWDENAEKNLLQDIHGEIQEAVARYLDTPPQRPESMLEYIYQNLPEAYQGQYEALLQE